MASPASACSPTGGRDVLGSRWSRVRFPARSFPPAGICTTRQITFVFPLFLHVCAASCPARSIRSYTRSTTGTDRAPAHSSQRAGNARRRTTKPAQPLQVCSGDLVVASGIVLQTVHQPLQALHALGRPICRAPRFGMLSLAGAVAPLAEDRRHMNGDATAIHDVGKSRCNAVHPDLRQPRVFRFTDVFGMPTGCGTVADPCWGGLHTVPTVARRIYTCAQTHGGN